MKPTVVLLHGLARTARSMSRLQGAIEAAGYPTFSQSYPSRRLPIQVAAAELAERIRAEVKGSELIAVTHSLGGILIRHMPADLPWSGVVMLAPPNSGSRIARLIHKNPLFHWFFGPAGKELCNPEGWPAPPSPFAVIAGTRSASIGNPASWLTRSLHLFSPDEPSDGTIAVSETRLAGEADFAQVDADHTWIMNHPETQKMVLQFLVTRRLTDRR